MRSPYSWAVDERGPVELIRDVLSGVGDGFSFLFTLVIGIALVVMGNTLARLIGLGLLAVWVYIAVRFMRNRAAG